MLGIVGAEIEVGRCRLELGQARFDVPLKLLAWHAKVKGAVRGPIMLLRVRVRAARFNIPTIMGWIRLD